MALQNEMIDTHHEEIIHDISFDFYGTRFATASSDQTIKIYQKIKNQWIKQSDLKCHHGPVWKVKWAHPQFGSIIATCSQDKAVRLWEEKRFLDEDMKNPSPSKEQSVIKSEWKIMQEITETKRSIQDIKFGIRQLGLVLALGFDDGTIQIYRKQEDKNLSQLQTVGEVMVNPYGIRTLSWNKYAQEQEMIVVGGNNLEDSFRKYQTMQNNPDEKSSQFFDKFQEMGQSQNVEKPIQSTLVIYGKESKGDWSSKWTALKCFDQYDTVNDVSWANLNGRSFHLIACADRQGINVWKVRVTDKQIEIIGKMNIGYYGLIFQTFRQVQQEAWRVSWNILATVIAAAYKAEEIKLFRNVNNTWICQATLQEKQDVFENGELKIL